MLKIYGSLQCPDCVRCLAELDAAGVSYEFLEFEKSLRHLKDFLKLRDEEACFDPIREQGSIGIPCILSPDGMIRFEWRGFLK